MTDHELLKRALVALESATSFTSMKVRDQHRGLVRAICLALTAPAQPEGQSADVDEMAAWVRRLVQALRKAAPGNPLAEKALDDLKRRGLIGDVLREAGAAAPAEGEAKANLRRFLDAAAGEGLVLDGVDAADLYINLFPAEYAAALAAPKEKP